MLGQWTKTGAIGASMGMLLTISAGCEEPDGAGASKPLDRGDLAVGWGAAPDPVSQAISDSFHQTRMFEDVAAELNGALKFPRNLPVAHVACGEENAFYDPRTGRLSMCYELLATIADTAYDPAISEEELGTRIVGTWMFVFFHELGHALIDMYDLPVTGKEEDAVDDFSTVLLIEAGLEDFAIRAAEYWAATDQDMYTELSFADEHSLNAQRFFSILCSVYGSDPARYRSLVTDGYLPETRAQRCPAEYQQKLSSWETLLEPWSK